MNAAVSSNLPQTAIIGWDAQTLLRELLTPASEQLSERVGIGLSAENPDDSTSSLVKDGGV